MSWVPGGVVNSHPVTEHFTDLFGGAIDGAESSDRQVVVVQTVARSWYISAVHSPSVAAGLLHHSRHKSSINFVRGH